MAASSCLGSQESQSSLPVVCVQARFELLAGFPDALGPAAVAQAVPCDRDRELWNSAARKTGTATANQPMTSVVRAGPRICCGDQSISRLDVLNCTSSITSHPVPGGVQHAHDQRQGACAYQPRRVDAGVLAVHRRITSRRRALRQSSKLWCAGSAACARGVRCRRGRAASRCLRSAPSGRWPRAGRRSRTRGPRGWSGCRRRPGSGSWAVPQDLADLLADLGTLLAEQASRSVSASLRLLLKVASGIGAVLPSGRGVRPGDRVWRAACATRACRRRGSGR